MQTLEERLNFYLKYRVNFLSSIFFTSNELKNKRILFYPRLPHPRAILYKICRELGIIVVNDPNKNFDILFAWQDATFCDIVDISTKPSHSFINLHCVDISKKNVDNIFEKVFGYSLSIDPYNHTGKCVIKSNLNAQHDGKIIECPTCDEYDNVVFQKIIDNIIDAELAKDIRVPVFGNSIPLVYHKIKKIEDRFTNEVNYVEVHETKNIFSQQEIEKIILFANEMKLDYGELDILRNNEDNKIYIVDVNKTPWGPPAKISKENYKYVITKMSEAFADNFLNVST